MIKNLSIFLFMIFVSFNSCFSSEDFCQISDTIGDHSMIYAPKRFTGEYTHILTGKDLIAVDLSSNNKDKIYVLLKKETREKALIQENKNYQLLEFNAKSALFTSSIVFNMWEQTIFQLGDGFNGNKERWNARKPVFICPYVESSQINAYYDRCEGSAYSTITFNFLPSSKTFMCQIFDVVAHETGHAFLDSIQPGYNDKNTIWNGALHESFGDISAVMSSMEVALNRSKFKEVSDFICNNMPIHINGPSIMSCIRKPSDYVGISTHEVHDISNIFTKSFFRSLSTLYLAMEEKNEVSLGKVLMGYRKSLLEAILSEKNLEEGNNSLLVNIAKSLVNNLQKIFGFDDSLKNDIFKPFNDDYSGLTHSIIFNPSEMESFGTIPVPHNIDQYKYHPII